MKGKIVIALFFLSAITVFASGKTESAARCTLLREPGGIRGLEIVGKYLYCGTRKDLIVYDISDPVKPVKAGVLKNIGCTRQISHRGNYLYITMRHAGIKIIDISKPAKPEAAGFYDTVEMATGIDIAGDLLFCAQRIYGVETLDISDPLKPRPLSLQRTSEAQSCVYEDTKLYVGDWGASLLTVIDMKDPAKPYILSQHKLDGYGDGVAVAGKYCYVSTGHHSRAKDRAKRHGAGHGLEIFSLENPAFPRFVSRIKFPRFHITGNDYWTVRVSGNTAVAADTHNGVFIVDVSDKKNPFIKQHIVFPEVKTGKVVLPACAADIELGNNAVYVAVQDIGLAVIPVNGVRFIPPRPEFKTALSSVKKASPANYDRYDFNCTVRRAAIKEDTAYIACSVKGIKVLNLASGKVIQEIPVPCAYDVTLDGNKLFCAAGYDGILTYEINSDMTLSEISRQNKFVDPVKKTVHTPCIQMAVKPQTGKLLAFSDRSAWVYFADTAQNMKLVHRTQWVRLLYGDAMPDDDINGIFPVHWCGYGTIWFDVSGDTAIEKVRTAEQQSLSGQSEGWGVLNGKFLAPSVRGYTLLAPENYGNKFEHHRCNRKFRGTVTVSGNIAAFACRVSGTVRVYDISDEKNPVELKDFALNIPGTCDRIRFWKGHLVVPAGLDGLLVSKKTVK